MRARVIGLGQQAAGDDGVGIAVVEELRRSDSSADLDLVVAREPSALLAFLASTEPVVVVDAVLASPSGQVVDIPLDALVSGGLSLVSTHGLDIGQAIALARLASPETYPRIHILGISIARPTHARLGLSSEVAAAIPRAMERIRALLAAP